MNNLTILQDIKMRDQSNLLAGQMKSYIYSQMKLYKYEVLQKIIKI